LTGKLPPLRLVAGADAAYVKSKGKAYAAVAVMSLPEFRIIEEATAIVPLRFPYVPGLLSFREAPVLLSAFRKLRHRPDAVIFDAQGYAHPRRLGLASHMGLVLDLPTAGCAKSRLIGEHVEPGARAGSSAPLLDAGERIGSVLRTRKGVKPLFVSVGHRLSLKAAEELVLRCVNRYRLPEPIRQAHRIVTALSKRDDI